MQLLVPDFMVHSTVHATKNIKAKRLQVKENCVKSRFICLGCYSHLYDIPTVKKEKLDLHDISPGFSSIQNAKVANFMARMTCSLS